MTNIMVGIAVLTSPSQGNDLNWLNPIPVRMPFTRPLLGSKIWVHMMPMTIAGTAYGKNEITR